MCGIAGYYGRKIIGTKNINSTAIRMRNRGPDNFAYERYNLNNNKILLLHSRLSIIELSSKANQPILFKDQVLIFNGEIYNYLELRDKMISKGVKFISNSDTEVLIKCLKFYGKKSFDMLEGMWAFALLDLKKNQLILSRDRFGEKPLYFKKTKGGIFFGSETRFIEKLSGYDEQVNNQKINEFLKYGFGSVFHDNHTFLQNLTAIEPGENLIISKDLRIIRKKYWKLNANNRKIKKVNLRNEIKNIKKILTNSVKLRLRSDVKNVFSLSGGVDSGSLVSISKKVLKYKTNTYSILSKDKKYNEANLINKTVKDTKVKNKIIRVKNVNFFRNLKSIVEYFNSPLLTINYIPLSVLLRNIKKANFKVLLTGNGSDEIFAGYYDHFIFHLLDLKHKKLKFNKNLKYWKKHILPNLRNIKLKEIIETKDFEMFNVADDFSKYFVKKFKHNYKFKNILKSKLKNNLINQFNERLYPSMYQDDLLCMKYSIENRSPFLDRNLVEKVFEIPSEYMIEKAYSKNLLRKSMKNILNEQVRLSRNKIGFNASLTSFNDISKFKVANFIFRNFNYISSYIKKKEFQIYIKNLDFNNLTDHDQKFIFRILSVVSFYKFRKSIYSKSK